MTSTQPTIQCVSKLWLLNKTEETKFKVIVGDFEEISMTF